MNERLQADLELQKELATLDRAWESEREQHKVRYGKNSALVEPTLGATVLASAFTLVIMIVGLVVMGGPSGDFPPPSSKACGYSPGSESPIYYVFKYATYQESRKEYQRRRESAVGRFRAKLDRGIRFLDGDHGPAVAGIGPETTDRAIPSPAEGETPGDAVGAPPSVATPSGPAPRSRHMRALIATLIGLVLVVGVLRTGLSLWHGNWGKAPRSDPRTVVVGSPPSIEHIPANDRSSAPVLVKHLASGDQKARVEAARLLASRPDLAEEAVPLLRERFEVSAASDAPESADLRHRILGLFATYGTAAKDAAPALIRSFGAIASRGTDEPDDEAEEILRTLGRFGPDPLVAAEVRAALAAAGAGRPRLEIARLVAAIYPQVPLADEDLVAIVKVVAEHVQESVDRAEIPDGHVDDVLVWVVNRSTGRPDPPAPLLDAIAELHRIPSRRPARVGSSVATSGRIRTRAHHIRSPSDP